MSETESEPFNYEKLDTDRENVIPVLTQRTKTEMQKAREKSEIGTQKPIETYPENGDSIPQQRFPTTEFEFLHTFRDHIVF